MSLESDVANQAVSMELEVIKLFGKGTWKVLSKLSAAAIAGISYVLKKHRQNKELKPGEINAKKMVDTARRNGVELQEFYIPKGLEKDFAKAVKERYIQVSFIKNKTGDSPIYTVLVHPNEANRVDRIIEELKINHVDTLKESADVSSNDSQNNAHMDDKSADDFFEAMNPDEVINEPDPFAQSRVAEDRSENGSENLRSENTRDSRNKSKVIYQYETVEEMRKAGQKSETKRDKPFSESTKDTDKARSSESPENRVSIKERMSNIKQRKAEQAKETPAKDTVINFAEKAKEIKGKGREQ